MIIKPLHNNVVVQQLPEEEQRYGNIIISDQTKEGERKGKVICVGPGSWTMTGAFIPMTVKEGDLVSYPTFGGQKLTIDNEEYFIFKEQDLLAIIEL